MSALTLSVAAANPLQSRFVAHLSEHKSQVASFALAAWDGETLDDVNTNLEHARGLLHGIAATAGDAGFGALAVTARHCEAQITAHLEGDYADLAICPGEILWFIDTFVEACDSVTG